MKQYQSMEDYLERILQLQRKNGAVRSIDIATFMNYSKASISIAMKKLKAKNYIVIDDQGLIHLTKHGFAIASAILEKHEIIADALMALGVSKDTAFADACRIEHDISNETFQVLKQHYLAYKTK